jgi:ABC-type antimicrobial peptide transport system permease subunit
LVLRQGLKLAVVGVALGVVGAVASSHIMASFVYGISTTDTLTFVLVPLGLIGVVLLACCLPAWRASKVDPMLAMKVD